MCALPDSWISTGSQPIFELGAGGDDQVGAARARHQAGLGLDAMHVLQRGGRDVHVDLLAAELVWSSAPQSGVVASTLSAALRQAARRRATAALTNANEVLHDGCS